MNKINVLGYILLTVVSLSIGYEYGTNKIQGKFDAFKYDINQETLRQKIKYEALDLEHKNTESIYLSQLQDLKVKYEEDIGTINADYNIRLLKSEERANYYRQQAASDENGLRDLADHASRLDKTLEEGRQLVKELRTALKLREEQLNTMGQVIINDRSKLINKGR